MFIFKVPAIFWKWKICRACDDSPIKQKIYKKSAKSLHPNVQGGGGVKLSTVQDSADSNQSIISIHDCAE